ncbi:hypothetical protein AAVH_11019 [Aphelenchoides avenae]|nr:hypothetical protein AAVH_11019 [Aphelenchus avenae]
MTKTQQLRELERLVQELVAKNAKSLKEHEEKHKKVEEAVKQEATGALRKMSDTAKVLEKRIRDDFDHLH